MATVDCFVRKLLPYGPCSTFFGISYSWDLVLVGIGDPNLFLEIGTFLCKVQVVCCSLRVEIWKSWTCDKKLLTSVVVLLLKHSTFQ
ncbi:hypothetical protein VNO78_13592 [Psophocarpus tetragonolobus]|uniref:Uncharacterized protein n=1 Tax=Psophocarpus tetragonolobus TaxID=3891 RepID=A0AAN9SQ89_PSOTE